jgi:hypothetical protein
MDSSCWSTKAIKCSDKRPYIVFGCTLDVTGSVSINTEVKLSRYTPQRCLGEGEGSQLLIVLDFGTRRGWVGSIMPRRRFTPGERNPGTQCTGGCVGPRAWLHEEFRRKSCGTVVQSVVRICTDWDMLPHNTTYRFNVTGVAQCFERIPSTSRKYGWKGVNATLQRITVS